MESRERILDAIELEEPDRVPLGEFRVNDPMASRVLGYDVSRIAKMMIRESSSVEICQARKDGTPVHYNASYLMHTGYYD